jgi:hypothetical protein
VNIWASFSGSSLMWTPFFKFSSPTDIASPIISKKIPATLWSLVLQIWNTCGPPQCGGLFLAFFLRPGCSLRLCPSQFRGVVVKNWRS